MSAFRAKLSACALRQVRGGRRFVDAASVELLTDVSLSDFLQQVPHVYKRVVELYNKPDTTKAEWDDIVEPLLRDLLVQQRKQHRAQGLQNKVRCLNSARRR